jgi:hypothetical protein
VKSETFYCPHCRRQLTKSPLAFIRGEMERGVIMGGDVPTVTCPGCGGAIDTQKMIDGKYDYIEKPWQTILKTVIGIAVFVFLIYKCS